MVAPNPKKPTRRQKREMTVKAYQQENESMIEQIGRMEESIARYHFILGCIAKQNGGLIEIHDRTADYVKSIDKMQFTDKHDAVRQMYMLRVKFIELDEDEKDDPSEARDDAGSAETPS